MNIALRPRNPHRMRLLKPVHRNGPGDRDALMEAVALCLADARAGRIRRDAHGDLRALDAGKGMAISILGEDVDRGIGDDDMAGLIVDALDRPVATRDEADVVEDGLSAIASMLETRDPEIQIHCPSPWQESNAWTSVRVGGMGATSGRRSVDIAVAPDVEALLPDMTTAALRMGKLVIGTGWWTGWTTPLCQDDVVQLVPDAMEAVRRLAALAALTGPTALTHPETNA